MGSRSKSATETTTVTTTDVENINVQGTEGPAIVDTGGDVSFTVTDQGAVESAFEFGDRALAGFSDLSNLAIERASEFARESLGLVERSATQAQKSFEGALSQTLQNLDEEQSGGAQRVMLLAIAALVGFVVLARGG